jgi:hypothetical protein
MNVTFQSNVSTGIKGTTCIKKSEINFRSNVPARKAVTFQMPAGGSVCTTDIYLPTVHFRFVMYPQYAVTVGLHSINWLILEESYFFLRRKKRIRTWTYCHALRIV